MTERHISLPRPENEEVAANFVPEGDEEVAKDEIQSTSKKSKDRTSPPTKELPQEARRSRRATAMALTLPTQHSRPPLPLPASGSGEARPRVRPTLLEGKIDALAARVCMLHASRV